MNDVADIPPETIVAKLREIASAIKAEGLTKLTIFGSRARGDARPDGDLDILVDTTGRRESPAFDLFKVMHLIEDVNRNFDTSVKAKAVEAAHFRADRRRSDRGVLKCRPLSKIGCTILSRPSLKLQRPHPELRVRILRPSAAFFARRLEGWPRVHALRPSFETHRFAMLLRIRSEEWWSASDTHRDALACSGGFREELNPPGCCEPAPP
jgi:predicted nucleotidyltransferase